MFCKHCGKEIANDAKFCAGCGKSVESVETEEPKKKKKKRHPILGTIILLIGIFILVGTVGGGSDEPQKVNNQPAAAAPAEDTVHPLFTVGDTLEMDNILVTLVNVKESTGSQFMTPADGNVFVICEFTIENKTDSEIAVSSMMSFEAYFDDYVANLSFSAMAMDQSKQQLDGSIAPGKKFNGVVGYEVPEDWASMEIRFSPNVYVSKSFVFNYSK